VRAFGWAGVGEERPRSPPPDGATRGKGELGRGRGGRSRRSRRSGRRGRRCSRLCFGLGFSVVRDGRLCFGGRLFLLGRLFFLARRRFRGRIEVGVPPTAFENEIRPAANQPMCSRFRAFGAKLQGGFGDPLNLIPLMPARTAGVLIRRHNSRSMAALALCQVECQRAPGLWRGSRTHAQVCGAGPEPTPRFVARVPNPRPGLWRGSRTHAPQNGCVLKTRVLLELNG